MAWKEKNISCFISHWSDIQSLVCPHSLFSFPIDYTVSGVLSHLRDRFLDIYLILWELHINSKTHLMQHVLHIYYTTSCFCHCSFITAASKSSVRELSGQTSVTSKGIHAIRFCHYFNSYCIGEVILRGKKKKHTLQGKKRVDFASIVIIMYIQQLALWHHKHWESKVSIICPSGSFVWCFSHF